MDEVEKLGIEEGERSECSFAFAVCDTGLCAFCEGGGWARVGSTKRSRVG